MLEIFAFIMTKKQVILTHYRWDLFYHCHTVIYSRLNTYSQKTRSITSRFSGNSEANASDIIHNLEERFSRYYIRER